MSFKWILSQADTEKLKKYVGYTVKPNYLLLKSKSKLSIISPILCDNNCKSEFQWELNLIENDVYSSYIQLNIYSVKINNSLDTFCAKYCVSLENANFKQYDSYVDKSVFYVNGVNPHIISKFTSKEIILSMLKQEYSLEIHFKVEIIALDNENNVNPISHEVPDFEKLLNNTKFSDFLIVCQGKEFNVHKNILAARSETFSAMFEHDMKEKHDHKVIIEDFTPEVIQELLRFMYCGKVENVEELCMDLLRAAKKYFIGGLGDVCLQSICKTLNISNALELLSLAVDCKTTTMKSKIINFIVFNLKEIRKQPEFKTFADPSSLQEILDKTAQVWL